MKIINPEHVKEFKKHITPEDCLRVFDFDETITAKGWNSFSPVHESDVSGNLDDLNDWMICIYESATYEQMNQQLKEKGFSLPLHASKKAIEQDYDTFKHEQMAERRIRTMQIGIETKVQIGYCDHTKFTPREGSVQLIQQLLNKGYDILVISAGVKNVIDYVFKNRGIDINHKHLTIVGNIFETNDKGIAIGYNDSLVTCFTKRDVNYQSYGIPEKKYALQFGDSYTDSMMVINYFDRDHLLNVGFTNGNEVKIDSFGEMFDIIFDETNSGMEKVNKELSN